MSEEMKDQLTEEEVVDTNEESAMENEEVVKDENNATAELEAKLAAMTDKYARLQAEFDNYRKRTLKEKMELTKSAGEKILVEILPVVDNFERALANMERAQDVEALREGVEIIYSSFVEFLRHQGIAPIDCMNKEFDTDLQEAITKIPAPTAELKGKVVDCVEKGYTLHDKVIRYAKVVVGE